ncbi:MAG TPA: lysylphosphatidylglycerol synthase transmembrane domain-containing protein [Streptosporangiaceae bacterium]|nr:lysylphosphatidylglycerol synthase transmembrane domain-containing protein [Streptosporangiaceae bacterium]
MTSPSTRQAGSQRRPVTRWIVRGVLFVALAAGVFGLLPRLGGLTHDAAGLRHARPVFVAAAVVAQAVSLACYALLYRRVLASLGARLRFRLAAEVTMASFLVSHVTPFGSATGTLLNVSTLEAEGVAASTTGEAIGLTSLVSTVALIALFGTGLVATAGRHVSATYLRIAGIALVLVVLVLGIALLVGAHPSIAERAARRVAGWARHVRRSIDPDKVAQASGRLVRLARSALTGRAFAESYGFASADLLFDLLSLDLMFLAFRYQPGFGPLAVAYAAANIASAIPVTPGGLGVIEVTLVAITVGFGAPRATAVLAVLGYRLVNYWLPLLPGAVAYLRLRLSLKAAGKARSPAPPAG